MNGYADTPDVSQLTLSRTTTPSSEFVVFVSNIIQGLWRNVEIGEVREKVSKNERQSFQTYVYRVMRRAKLSYAAIIIALNYINLLSKKRDQMPSLKIRTAECMATEEARIVVVSFILANKHFYDHAYRNKTWSKMTGIDKNVLYYCEKEALAALNYDLTVSPQRYTEWLSTLEATSNVITDDIDSLNETISNQYNKATSPMKQNSAYSLNEENINAKKFETATLPRNFESVVN
ncbi:hypothetical protein BCR36DRAFT_411725 [Piromyces finnis]|uniref:Cyclin N-terminal domain-containing protein n=1 Tax=Piromyces finnis TaxID=1754191 RepID=A0A1Y1VB16_9FUNG|nr:hypothetical protein BCR36DRAFT_411725 [Piromyces finnis]|eukprot:ORX51751.1 hypothetical protein BCR36DRAFT_411725 [Piromyces finnis]